MLARAAEHTEAVGLDQQYDMVLNTRDEDLLRLLGRGLANKEIAEALHRAESTIKNELSMLYRKLGVQDRTQAVIMGIQLGVVSIENVMTQ